MEAPDKLYLHPNYKGEVGSMWLTIQITNEDIEYTRTDAFIEKAITWLKENITNDHTASKVISRKGCVTMDMLIEDFIKAMKI